MEDQPIDPFLRMPVEVRAVQPYQARKEYICPGCTHTIGVRVGHVVVVPQDDPGLRRHWHRPCWERRSKSASGKKRPG